MPCQADIVLLTLADEDREAQKHHARELANTSIWSERTGQGTVRDRPLPRPRLRGDAMREKAVSPARGETPPPHDEPAILAQFLEHAPPVCEPFCGGGSIPLEAQR